MKDSKKEWLMRKMLERGMTYSEANTLLRLNNKCNLSSLLREWRAQAAEEEKDREREQVFRNHYSPTLF